jgi:hypothetical protein
LTVGDRRLVELDPLHSLSISIISTLATLKNALTMASQLSTLGELTPYKYRPISQERGIRAMRLLPGSASSEIRIDFRVDASAWDPDAPEVEALSYTWGSSANPVDIIIQAGESSFCTLSVTQNLAEALRYLRLEDKPRLLWIDAICVNQQDMHERSSQVELMADIYSLAKKVVVWLGPESHDSSIALECIEMIDSRVEIDWKEHWAEGKSEETCWGWPSKALPFNEHQYEALFNFFSRPWFSRLWIWQEVKLASSPPVVMIGARLVSWKAVQAAAFSLKTKPRQTVTFRSPIAIDACFDMAYNLCNDYFSDDEGFVPLRLLLNITRSCLCTDPRDRIFALLSLITESDLDLGIRPDYTKTTHEVYQDALLCWIETRKDLALFNGIDIDEKMESLPTWVPNWSTRREYNRSLNIIQASHETRAETIYLGEGKLKVTGISVAVIKDLEVLRFDDIQDGYSVVEVRRLLVKSQLLSPFTSDDNGLRILLCVLSANTVANRYEPSDPMLLDIEPSVHVLSKVKKEALDEEPWDDEWIPSKRESDSCIGIKEICTGRAAFSTEDGRLGLAPKSAKPGDIVTVLLGCRTAMILRPCEGNEFQVVGEALCHGFIDGEALLGPLPEGIERVLQEVGVNEFRWTCIDRSTEICNPEDPRLGKLPDGWKIVEHDYDGYWSLYENDELGITDSLDDPRLTPEALMERGVNLENFVLI